MSGEQVYSYFLTPMQLKQVDSSKGGNGQTVVTNVWANPNSGLIVGGVGSPLVAHGYNSVISQMSEMGMFGFIGNTNVNFQNGMIFQNNNGSGNVQQQQTPQPHAKCDCPEKSAQAPQAEVPAVTAPAPVAPATKADSTSSTEHSNTTTSTTNDSDKKAPAIDNSSSRTNSSNRTSVEASPVTGVETGYKGNSLVNTRTDKASDGTTLYGVKNMGDAYASARGVTVTVKKGDWITKHELALYGETDPKKLDELADAIKEINSQVVEHKDRIYPKEELFYPAVIKFKGREYRINNENVKAPATETASRTASTHTNAPAAHSQATSSAQNKPATHTTKTETHTAHTPAKKADTARSHTTTTPAKTAPKQDGGLTSSLPSVSTLWGGVGVTLSDLKNQVSNSVSAVSTAVTSGVKGTVGGATQTASDLSYGLGLLREVRQDGGVWGHIAKESQAKPEATTAFTGQILHSAADSSNAGARQEAIQASMDDILAQINDPKNKANVDKTITTVLTALSTNKDLGAITGTVNPSIAEMSKTSNEWKAVLTLRDGKIEAKIIKKGDPDFNKVVDQNFVSNTIRAILLNKGIPADIINNMIIDTDLTAGGITSAFLQGTFLGK